MKIKKNYKQIVQEQWFCSWDGTWRDRWYDKAIGKFRHTLGYHRNIRTFNERKQNHYAKCDGIKVRGNRKHLRTNWDDPRRGRTYGRSWKDYTKRKKQWDR